MRSAQERAGRARPCLVQPGLMHGVGALGHRESRQIEVQRACKARAFYISMPFISDALRVPIDFGASKWVVFEGVLHCRVLGSALDGS